MSQIFTVFGATGNQGGSVVKHVLAHPELSKKYKIRAVTRDPSKPAGVALKEKGCEVVSADTGDVESLKKAIEGSAVVFGVTNYWEKMDMALEIQQGKNMADACKAAGAHFIWSSLPDVTKGTNGAITAVEHFDSKAQVEEYIRSIGLPATFFMPGMFMSVGISNMRKMPDGKYALTLPFPPETTKVPLYSPADDTGTFVAAALLLPEETLNQRIAGCAGYISPAQIVADFVEATGLEASYKELTWEQFHAALPPPAADELTGNFKLVVDFGYYVGEPEDFVEKSLALVKKAGLKTPMQYKEYVKANFKAT